MQLILKSLEVKMRYVFFTFLLFYCTCYGKDDIEFYGGCRLKNVFVVEKSEDLLIIKKSNGIIINFEKPNVRKILEKSVNINEESILSGCAWIDPIQKIWDEQNEISYSETQNKRSYANEFSNLKLLPVSIIAGMLSYDYFEAANDISDSISKQKDIDPNSDVSNLESRKSRARFFAFGFAIVGVVNAVFAFTPVNVEVSKNSVNLSYNF